MTKKSSSYWQKRMAALEDSQYKQSAEYYKDVQKQYREASNSIQMDIERWYQRLADNNNLSYAGAKKLLKKDEMDEFHWSVEQYIKAGEENAVDQRWMKELENASARHHISYLEAMKMQTQQHAELLSTEFEGGMTEFLHKSYGDQYYHTAFEIAKGTGLGSDMAQIDSRTIDTLIKKPWAQDGKNFSDRIWTNKDKLVNNLHTELTQSIIRGADPKQAIDNLAKTMEVSKAQAGRLIMTESAAISAVAQKDCFKDLDVERYEILATLDSHTSDICQEMDGKVFEMKDYEVGTTAPPFHPNCRSTTIPYFDDEFTEDEERAARDEDTGKTYYVPADMKYEEWKKHYLEDYTEGTISYEGIPKTWGKLSDTDNVSDVNPLKSQTNCVNCTVAYEMRKRGYAVVAGSDIKKLRHEPFSAWKEPDIIKVEKDINALDSIKVDMKKWGNGARAQVSVVWNKKNGSRGIWDSDYERGHSFIAEQRNGATFFLDVQTGKVYNEDVFNKVTDHEVQYCRIDILEINDLGATACRKE